MILLAIVLVLFGLPLLVGGVWLISLGGSWYYALSGTTLIVIALLVKPRLGEPSKWRYLTRHCLAWSGPVHRGQHSL